MNRPASETRCARPRTTARRRGRDRGTSRLRPPWRCRDADHCRSSNPRAQPFESLAIARALLLELDEIEDTTALLRFEVEPPSKLDIDAKRAVGAEAQLVATGEALIGLAVEPPRQRLDQGNEIGKGAHRAALPLCSRLRSAAVRVGDGGSDEPPPSSLGGERSQRLPPCRC